MTFSINCSKRGTHVIAPRGKIVTLISNVLGKGMALNYLSPPTKMGENPTKTWKL
jgi:hypothetical protein